MLVIVLAALAIIGAVILMLVPPSDADAASKKAGAPGGLELSSWVQLDAQNQRTTVRLSGHQYGVPVSDSAFKFKDPRTTTRRPG